MQGATIRVTQTIFSLSRAKVLAKANNATDEDGWTYTVVAVEGEDDKAIVVIKDETGQFVGTF